MATRSAIGIQCITNTVKSIYCLWDGYPSNNGSILRQNYDAEKTEQLMELGDLSSLGVEIGEKQDFNDAKTQHEDWCLAYGRDRGETDVEHKTHDSPEEFVKYWSNSVAYIYMLDLNGMWVVWDNKEQQWTELTEEMCE